MRFQQTDSSLRNQQASIQNLEIHIGQISKMLSERPSGSLPSTTESNSKENCKAITLRLGKQLSGSLPLADKDDMIVQDEPANEGLEPEVVEIERKKEDRQKSPNKLPLKRRDPGSFTVPCVTGDLPISSALAYLGASINLMPTSSFGKLGLHEPKPTRMSIQLADRTVKIPRGIIEDVFVKGESTVPLILGRPFLATSRAVIDVSDGKLKLRVDDETITFDLAIDVEVCQVLKGDFEQQEKVRGSWSALAKDEEELSNEQVLEQLAVLLASEPSLSTNSYLFLDKFGVQNVKTSFEDPPVLELKELSSHWIYVFLDEEKRLPVIIAADLTPEEQTMLLEVLRKYKKAFTFKIADIPDINPSFCSHKILLGDSFRPVVQPQRRSTQT
ncbi:uncharacterized protein LOC125368725 [Ricinus communis]|uniref:uncharacterized protein LOC125368725 n=1 Tax=Ricinus communis TaxID=3988 RepID=UPI00201AA629|nr:uncharacterized protein LOC125368725 [Ricinus communis]